MAIKILLILPLACQQRKRKLPTKPLLVMLLLSRLLWVWGPLRPPHATQVSTRIDLI